VFSIIYASGFKILVISNRAPSVPSNWPVHIETLQHNDWALEEDSKALQFLQVLRIKLLDESSPWISCYYISTFHCCSFFLVLLRVMFSMNMP
jgi:hypothetical protein